MKKIFVTALISTMVLSLAACGEEKVKTPLTPAATEETTEVTTEEAPQEATEEVKEETTEETNVGMANPWSDAADADTAAEASGVGYFIVPANNGTYNDQQITISGFRYMEHLAEANGAIGAADFTIRKGLKQESSDVSGDYTEYAYNWSFESNDGFEINCYGNEEGKTMKATWLSDNFSYSLFVRGQGDEYDTYGLDEETMKLIVEDIQ